MTSNPWRGEAPIFSILTPVWHPEPDHLRACIDSVRAQTTAEWELCLVADGPQPPEVDRLLDVEDDRIRVHRRPENGGIAAATDDALAMARGEFIALLDHDDTLAPEALGTTAWEIDGTDEVDFVFTDEDHLDSITGERINPFYKPGFSMERLRQQMYFGHMIVCRRSLALEVGGFRPGFDGSQDHDLALRAVERARKVLHIPKLLYHWRESPTSTAMDSEAKDWAYEAGVRVVASHLERTGFPARPARNPDWPGIIDLEPELADRPKVSIIIPTGGAGRIVHGRDVVLVEQALRSIAEKSTYPDFEVIVVLDRHSPESLVATLREVGGSLDISFVGDSREFNFSKACNLGAVRAAGQVLVFLNDDTEVSMSDWMERLVMYSTRPDIGAVGAKLLYGDGRIQHAGTWSRYGNPAHRYVGYLADHPGYLAALATAQNCVSVSAACLAVERSKFDEVGGFTPLFPLAYNDVDLCLKLSRSGYRTVVDCATEMVHHESSSQDPSVADWELDLLQRRWGPVLAADPYDNPNHSADGVEEYPPTSTFVADLRDHFGESDFRARAWPSDHEHLRC
ncbi:MAG: glycosyltransferase family 2 protein [Acidimicrobiales bacterium]